MQTSVLSEYIAALLKHSLLLDGGRETDNSFIELQKLEARITRAYQTGHYNDAEHKALTALAAALHKEYRAALKLDR